MLPASASRVRLAWERVAPGTPRRETAWRLLRELAPGARLSNPCPRCGGDHGPVRLDGGELGAEVEASVTYAGDFAIVGIVARSAASALGIDAETGTDPQRDAAGLGGILGEGRPADLRTWTRVEAALKADGRGLRVDAALVEVTEHEHGWTARVPDRSAPLDGVDLEGPPGILVSAAVIALRTRDVYGR